MDSWQVQKAKSHFSELLDKAINDGPQTITKHGIEKAVLLSVEEYHRLVGGEKKSFIEHLLAFPKFDDFELPPRQIDAPRHLNLFDDDEPGETAA